MRRIHHRLYKLLGPRNTSRRQLIDIDGNGEIVGTSRTIGQANGNRITVIEYGLRSGGS